MQTAKSISIIIPALHRPDLTAKCIESLRQQRNVEGEIEIVVVENAARPGFLYEAPAGSGVRSVLLSQNLGTTGSINLVLAAGSPRFVLLLNNDVQLEPDFLEELRRALMDHPEAGFATGKLVDGRRQGYLDGAGDAMLMGGGAFRLGHGDADSGQFDHSRLVLGGCGAAVLFRGEVLAELGGLDEQLFAYLDDIDLGLRAHLRGYSGLYVPRAVAAHIGSATLGNPLHAKIISWITRNQILLVIKNYPGRVLIRLLPRLLVYQALWAARVFARGAVVPYLRGILEMLWGLPRALRDRKQRQRTNVMRSGEFLQCLQESERQIYEWHLAQERNRKSLLLRVYFGLFGAS